MYRLPDILNISVVMVTWYVRGYLPLMNSCVCSLRGHVAHDLCVCACVCGNKIDIY